MSLLTAQIPVIGRGGRDADLSPRELREILEEALSAVPVGASVLAIVADNTRDDNTDLLFPFSAQILQTRKLKKFDVLIAQGTHSPMSQQDKLAKLGAGSAIPGLGEIFDHEWMNPSKLISIGTLDESRVAVLSEGLVRKRVDLRVNHLLAPGKYDAVLIFGTTMPHEVAGFSGGAKYFFPGVSGPELTHMTHWLGALVSIEKTIGRIETPTRHLFEAAADHVPTSVISLNSVVTRSGGRLRTHALFCGDYRHALRQAAAVSRHVHIKYTGRKYRRVVALLDDHLRDLWVGGKASYRLGAVIEEGGELIIYAPHLTALSDVHGELIKRYGYAPIGRVRELVEQSEELRQNLCVAAHLAHVSYAGRTLPNGTIVPRYSITLASAVDENTCGQVNLGYMRPEDFERSAYANDPDTLIVEQAGRDLYLVEPLAD